MVKEAILRWTVAGGGGGVSVLYFSDTATAVSIDGTVGGFMVGLAPRLASTTRVALDATLTHRNTVTGLIEDEETIDGPPFNVGTGSPAVVPNLAQGLIRFQTQAIISGRRLRGRMFIPGLAYDSANADGNVGSTTLLALQLAGDELRESGELVVWHRPVNGAGGVASVVTTTSPWAEFASQRRRRS